MLDRRARAGVEEGLRPFARALGKTPISPDGLTLLGLVFSLGTFLFLAGSRPGWALATLILSGVTDILDGNVAKASGQQSKRGAFFDSVADRVSDALMFGGVAWYLTQEGREHTPFLAIGVMACSMIISYERAKAESLAYEARGGLMERAERMVLLGVGLAYTPLLVPLLWVMLTLTAATAVFRFFRVWRQAEPPPLRPGSIGYKRAQADAAGAGEPSGGERSAHEPRRTTRAPGPARRRHRSPR
jgi:CDP-diacylglycerol---glycerol-3-phosphate 3-phosphatidyltransferase